jgi:AcrR family transcriptional regulator
MPKKKLSTRELLIKVSGKLFADNGFKGTSIKMIASQSKQNIASVNYHFGSKENLYIEVLKVVLAAMGTLNDSEKKFRNKKEAIADVQEFISSLCHIFLNPEMPSWYGSLFNRAVNEPNPKFQKMVHEFIQPGMKRLQGIASTVKKDLAPEQAYLWACSVMGQIVLFVTNKKLVLITQKADNYTPEFVDSISNHITDMSVSYLLKEGK